ncbi:RANB3 protein, partial [Turnix velox]|nr:RANB3 protein [Turnix velox]
TISLFTEKPAIAPPVFVFQKDKAQKSPTEQKGLSDSGETHHGVGQPGPASVLPAPVVALASAAPSPAVDTQLPPVHQGLTGRSADGSSPEDGDESDHEDGSYCPPVKRERTSSLTQFPPSQSEEKSSGFRLKPPILIHGQAPSAGVPSQKPKEQQRSVLRPAVLQAPQPKVFSQMVLSSGTNGVNVLPDSTATSESLSNTAPKSSDSEDKVRECQKRESNSASDDDSSEKVELSAQQAFVFGQNLRDRVKLGDESDETADVQNTGLPPADQTSATNYFLQYISSSVENSASSADASSNKFVFGQNMSERVLSPPKSSEGSTESNQENAATESGSESSSQEATPEKESLAESAAAYTKATARKCLLAKVEVITGEEAESNVLQVR